MTSNSDSLNKIRTSARHSRHLQLASKRLDKCWFPVDPKLLENIMNGIKMGDYHDNPVALVDDIKKDYALFMNCLKGLVQLLHKRHGKETTINPVEAIAKAKVSDLEAALAMNQEAFLFHTLEESNQHQISQLQHSMVSATVAETLSEYHDVNPDMAYTCALMRQLGLTLIAWNYPGMYQNAAMSSRDEASLDAALNKMLGFSPSILSIVIARQWNLSPEIRHAIGERDYKDELSIELENVGSTLEKLCEIGETFASCLDPNHPTYTTKSWELARLQITRTLGENGIQLIMARVEENCRHYTQNLPELFYIDHNAETLRSLPTRDANALAFNNHHMRVCPQLLQDKLQELYQQLDSTTISRDNVHFLIRQVIPISRFKSGCVYLLDPPSAKLIPRLPIGDVELASFMPVDFKESNKELNPIGTAYRSNALSMKDNLMIRGEKLSYIAGVLGEVQKTGVLYLEYPKDLTSVNDNKSVACFKAIRQALCDCLNVF